MSDNTQIQWLLNAATVVFKTCSESARLDAELLLCHVLDCNRTYLFTWPDKELRQAQAQQFYQLVELRKQGKPIAHITGSKEFWSIDLYVTPATLIPRPDTEILVESALSYALTLNNKKTFQGLDLGTGTGAIALALASELNHWEWLGVDLIDDAVKLAQKNASKNNIVNCQFLQSSWFSQVPQKKYDLIVSNPPYIDPIDEHLKQGDVRFEPLTALISDNNGLADIQKIIKSSKPFLSNGAPLFIEHGYEQAEVVRNIFESHFFKNVMTVKDLSGNDRVTVGYLI